MTESRTTASARYAAGQEYVICPECGSHILLDRRYLNEAWREADTIEPISMPFSCDWEGCGEEFYAMVRPPRLPFRVLRSCYEHALETAADNPGDTLTARDYWPYCVLDALQAMLLG